MKNKPNPRKIGIMALFITVSMLTVIILYGAHPQQVNLYSSGSQNPNSPGAFQSYVWDVGSSVTLQQAKQTGTFPILVPSYLPAGSTLNEVRVTSDGGFVMLGYANPSLVSIPNDSKGLSIIVVERVQNTNPFVASTSPPEPIITQVQYPNGTIKSWTQSQSYSGPNYTTIDGHLVLASTMNGFTDLQWWSNGIFYNVVAALPLQDAIQIAHSLGL